MKSILCAMLFLMQFSAFTLHFQQEMCSVIIITIPAYKKNLSNLPLSLQFICVSELLHRAPLLFY